jgi:hypothetical protein
MEESIIRGGPASDLILISENAIVLSFVLIFIIRIIIVIIIILFSYHRFSFPWYFSS